MTTRTPPSTETHSSTFPGLPEEIVPPNTGTCKLFLGVLDDPITVVADLLREWAETIDDGPQHVKGLQRFPEGKRRTHHRLTTGTPQQVTIDMAGLREYARTIHGRAEGAPDRLTGPEAQMVRQEALLKDYNCKRLARATDLGHLDQIGRPITEARSQGEMIPETDNETLAEIRSCLADVQAKFHEHDALAPDTVIPWTTNRLEQDRDLRTRMQAGTDLVVVLDAEEVSAAEWDFIAAMTTDTPVVALTRAHTATSRLFNESGGFTPNFDSTPETVPQAIAVTLATGRRPEQIPTTGTAQLIRRPTQIQEWHAIEQRLRQALADGRQPSDLAVVCRDDNAPVGKINRQLRKAGLPTAATTIEPFKSPLAREFAELFDILAWGPDAETPVAQRFERLTDSDFALTVAELRTYGATEAGIRHWIDATNLVDRATGVTDSRTGPAPTNADIRTDAAVVDRALQFAQGVDELDLDPPANWQRLAIAFDRFCERKERDLVTSQPLAENAIVVTTARAMKFRRREVVIIPSCTAAEQARLPTIPGVFSRQEISTLSEYSANFAISTREAIRTFSTVDPTAEDMHREYFEALGQRQWSIAARAARETLVLSFGGQVVEPAPLINNLQAHGFRIEQWDGSAPGATQAQTEA